MKPLVTTDGYFAYQSKRLTIEQAQSFAACVSANSTRFTNVQTVHDPKAKGARCWRVVFQPVGRNAMAAIGERENHSRLTRAEQEGVDYIYLLDVSAPQPHYRVFNPHSGETYELDSSTCTCPDFQYRCGKVPGFGLYCKHQHEMARRFTTGELVRLADAYHTSEYYSAHGSGYDYGVEQRVVEAAG